MTAEERIVRATAFLEPARTAIDVAEIAIVSSLTHSTPALKLSQGAASIGVAAQNLRWCAEKIVEIAQEMLAELENATGVDGPTAGRTVPAEQKDGGNCVP